MVRSAPPENASLPEVMTQPLIAASAATVSTICDELVDDLEVDDVHRAAGHVPGRVRDAVGVGLEAEIREVHRGLLTRAIAGQAKGSPARLV